MLGKKRIHSSLVLKLIPVVCLLIGLSSFILVWLTGQTQKETSKKRFEIRHKTLVNAVCISSVKFVQSRNTQQLINICKATRYDEDVMETVILDPFLKCLGHSEENQVWKDFSKDPWLKQALEVQGISYRRILVKGGIPEAEAAAPVTTRTGKVIGLAYSRVSQKTLYDELEEISRVFLALPHSLSGIISLEKIDGGLKIVPFKGVGFTWCLLLASSVVTLICLSMILLPINRLALLMEKMAEGDLSKKINVRTGDETGRLGLATNQMTTKLEGLVREVQGLSGSVSTGVSRIGDCSHRCNESTKAMFNSVTQAVEGAERQLGKVQEAETIIAEISEIVRLGAENVQNNFITTQQTACLVMDGQVVFESLLHAVGHIQGAVDEVCQILRSLELQCQELFGAEETVRKLAQNTEILAGEAQHVLSPAPGSPREFSKLLARMERLSASSAKKAGLVANALSGFRLLMTNTLEALDNAKMEAQNCLDLCADTGAALETIYTTVNQGKTEITEIQRVCEALHDDNNVVIEAMKGIRDFSRQNAAFAEDVARVTRGQTVLIELVTNSAASLSRQGEELVKQVNLFKVS